MKLYIKQKVFSWGDSFRIYDENGEDRYTVKGEVFSFGKKLHLFAPDGTERCFIHQKVWSFRPRYFISRDGRDEVEVIRAFTFFHPRYEVIGPGWTVEGNFLEHDYTVSDNGRTVAAIAKRWFTWGDTYEIDVAAGYDEVTVMAVVLVLDAVTAQQGAAAASASN